MVEKSIVFTYDYEVFFVKSGTAQNCLIRPVNVLLELFAKQNMKATFFVDASYLLFMQRYWKYFKEDYCSIEKQLCELVKCGHRVELHLHPHWNDTVYKDGFGIHANFDRYRLGCYEEEEIIAQFFEGKRLLESIVNRVDVDYKIIAFRAGGWCIQPFSKLKKGLYECGIRVDSSVAAGMHDETRTHKYDFTQAPVKECYRFSDNPLVEDNEGPFLEVPISVHDTNPMEKIAKRIIAYRNKSKIKRYGDGYGIQVSKYTLARKLFEKKTMFSTDGVFSCDVAIKHLNQCNLPLVTYISHPKNLTSISVDFLKRVEWEEYRFLTFVDIYSCKRQ